MINTRFRWGIREKLTLLFFGVTLVAVSVNFLVAVPRLEQRLRSDRVKAMRMDVSRFRAFFEQTAVANDQQLTAPVVWDQNIASISSATGDRVAILKPLQTQNPLAPQFQVFEDPSGETPQGSELSDPVAWRAYRGDRLASGLAEFGSGLHAEAAVPITVNGQTSGVAVFSTSLANVSAIVQQQARRSIFAAVLALAFALAAGLLASSFIARRIRRLERAAREVSKGNFTQPLKIDSRDELGELARAFNTMQDRLGRADRARKAFIANASHELRTPLFSLGGYVELMREEDLDVETQREFLDIMHRQIDRMARLATDLLDLSKIDTGTLDIQPEHVDLGELAKGMAREFGPRALEHDSGITVKEEEHVEAVCDPDRVAQIVRILVDNALAHTPAGTDVEVALGRADGAVELKVADNGPGISDEDLPRIFERFHTGNKTGGTGLGLSIARELAHAMGGRLDVATGAQGTAFSLRLPSAETPQSHAREPRAHA